MAIYISTDKPIPTIPYDEKNRKLNTEDVTYNEETLKNVFSKSNIKYIGSDQGCGCGFRHALIHNDNWLDVVDDEETPFDNSNHTNLVDLITKNNTDGNTFEVLACWEGDHNEPILYRETIKLTDILAKDFHFKERGLYTVRT
jgi:hypothetical protein